MDVGTISIILVIGLVFLLGIGMPLGFASAVLAALVGGVLYGVGMGVYYQRSARAHHLTPWRDLSD